MNGRSAVTVFAAATLLHASGASGQNVAMGHAAASDVAVRIVGPIRSLKVIGWNRDSVAISGFLPPTHRLQDVFSGDPGVPVRAAKLYIEGPEQVVQKMAFLEVRVPAGARVWIRAGTADLDVGGVTGEIDVSMVGGNIRVTGSPRTLNVEAMDASVTIDGLAEWSRVKTAAGGIDATGGGADAAYSTVSGSINVRGGAFERGRFESVTGNVFFGGDMGARGSLLFETHSGRVDVSFGPKAAASIEAETGASGLIENLLTRDRAVAPKDGRGQELAFEWAGGGARVVIRTFKGVVRLLPRT